MKRVLLGVALATACSTVAFAQPYPNRGYVYPPPPPGISADELRDYRRDQLNRRQAMERASLEMRQKAERRALDAEDDD